MVIGFIVFASAITSSLVGYAATGLHDRVILDSVRNREYDADAAIENAIPQAYTPVETWVSNTTSLVTYLQNAQCGSGYRMNPAPNGGDMTVQCTPAPTLTGPGANVPNQFQYNVIFTACRTSDVSSCSQKAIIRAQVNYSIASGTVQRTYIQNWSVNG